MAESDTTLATVISIAQSILIAGKGSSLITPTLIGEKVDIAANLVAVGNAAPFDRMAAIAELIRRFSLWIGQDTMLSDSVGHKPWLGAARKQKWRYWPRYQDMLERQMSSVAVEAVDSSTDKILSSLEDPNRPGAWDRRGLVVGHVQSGKTANYSGIICKAADSGYKIVIVLAGLHNNLRSQTQIRLEEAFLGFETNAAGDALKPVGVGELDSDLEIRPNCATNRSNNGDFNTKIAKHLAIAPEHRPWLFVVKKNKTVLDRLLKWIREHVADTSDTATGRRIVTNLPLLLIDDEADHASVDTGEQFISGDGTPDDEHEPKAINSRIRKILHSFAKKAYVGYTATPFANIFIHRQNSTSDEGADLFPQSFIINLAAPSNYVGPARVFGLRTPDGRAGGLPLSRIFTDHVNADGSAGWMPPRHRKHHAPAHNGQDILPPSLRLAVYSFVLACAARAVRGQGEKHSSMLVHVTRYTMVQSEVHRQIEEFVKKTRQRITRGNDRVVVDELRALWDEDFIPTSLEIAVRLRESEEISTPPSWLEILAEIPDVLSDIDVRMINGTAKDALDYSEGGNGLKVIAIGGDKLARGLTLEGLCTSYFVRTTKMYDTLMQMGRWFGYRPGYVDLCRLFTTEELVEWFGHIADASEELREEFEAMAESGATPRDYGLRVQSHPVLLVTSPLKMRTAKNLQLSFSGDLLETVSMHTDEAILKRNLDTTNRLIAACGAVSEKDPRRKRIETEYIWKGFLWNDVDSEEIAEFFDAFVTHPKARKVNSALLREFVRSMAAAGELTSWTVALLGGGTGGPHTFEGNLTIDAMSKRSADLDISDRYAIGRLLSPRDEAIDLDDIAWRAALDRTQRAWKPDPARQKDGVRPSLPETPNGPAVRFVRGRGCDGVAPAPNRGLLLLYPLDPQQAGAGVFGERTLPVMAFGVSFPTSNSGVKVEYAVDHLTWTQEYGPAD